MAAVLHCISFSFWVFYEIAAYCVVFQKQQTVVYCKDQKRRIYLTFLCFFSTSAKPLAPLRHDDEDAILCSEYILQEIIQRLTVLSSSSHLISVHTFKSAMRNTLYTPLQYRTDICLLLFRRSSDGQLIHKIQINVEINMNCSLLFSASSGCHLLICKTQSSLKVE